MFGWSLLAFKTNYWYLQCELTFKGGLNAECILRTGFAITFYTDKAAALNFHQKTDVYLYLLNSITGP